MPSWASLLTSTANARYPLRLRVLPALRVVLVGPQTPSLFVVSQHRRSFVFEVLVKELSIRSIMIRWRYPFPWHDWFVSAAGTNMVEGQVHTAWKGYAYASGAIEPAWREATSEFLAEVGCEVVAVLGEEIVRGPHELLRGLLMLAKVLTGSMDKLPRVL
jgi:hypothetical protein